MNPETPMQAADAELDTLLQKTLAKRNEKLKENATRELPIPTWDGKVLAVYGHMNEADYNRFVGRLGPDPKPSLGQAQDILIASCQGIILVEDGERHTIAEGYGRKLANCTAMESAASATARDVVLYMCGGHTMELTKHAERVIEFLQGEARKAEDETVGEFETSSE